MLLLLGITSIFADNIAAIVESGRNAERNNDNASAIKYYTRLIDKCYDSKSDTNLCKGLLAGGNCCSNSNRYIEALQFYTLAIEQAEKVGADGTKLSCLNNIGSVYALFGDYERAAHYYEQAYDIAVRRKDDALLSILSINLVKIYSQLNDTRKAKEFLHLQMTYPQKNKFANQYYILRNQGIIAKAEKNYKLADSFFQQAAETVRQHNLEKDDLSDVLIETGDMKLQQGKTRQATDLFKEAASVAIKGNYLFQLENAYQKLANSYKIMNVKDSAEHYQSLFVDLSDSIFNQRMFNNAKNDLFKYEDRVNDEHIGILENTIGGLGFVISVALITVLLVLYHNKKLRAAHKLLIVKNEELIRQAQENKQLRKEQRQQACMDNGDGDRQGRNGEETQSVSIAEEKRAELIKAIQNVMDQTEIISDPEFNLNTLSKMVGSNSKYVSIAINDTYNKNFKTFLNEYRIREASIRLVDKENYGMLTISAIGESVGFSSTNGFIIAFKKIVGMTPSVYKRLKGD